MGVGRRQLLKVAAGGVVGAFWRRSGTESDGPTDGHGAGFDDFDPAVHGFGFSNWEGDTGTGANGREFAYEPGDVTEGDVRRAIDESWTAALSEAKQTLMTRVVYSWIGSNAATNGHCYGMSFAAADYFERPAELPPTVDSASEIPHPTGAYHTVGGRIRRLQASQLLRLEPYWFALLGLRWGLADHAESVALLVEALDESGTAGIALDGEANPHQVLARGYEQRGQVTDIFVYDPTYPAAEYEETEHVWTLSFDHETGDILDIADGYDSFLYHDREMDSAVLDRVIGDKDRVLGTLSNAVFLGLEAGERLAVDAPAEALVDRPSAEFAGADAPFNDSVLVAGSFDELNVSVEGESGETYSLELFGLRDGEPALEEVFEDTFRDAPTRLRLAVDEAGRFVVDVLEGTAEDAAEGASEAAEAVEEGAEAAGERAGEAGENVNEDVENAGEAAGESAESANDGLFDRLRWLAAAAGATAFGVGYWLLGRRDGEP